MVVPVIAAAAAILPVPNWAELKVAVEVPDVLTKVSASTLRNPLTPSEAAALKGYPTLFALWIAARFFRKTGRWTPLLALPAGYAGVGLATAIGRLLLADPSIHVMGALTLARSAGRSAAVLAIGYLLLWLTGRLRRGKEMEP